MPASITTKHVLVPVKFITHEKGLNSRSLKQGSGTFGPSGLTVQLYAAQVPKIERENVSTKLVLVRKKFSNQKESS